MQFTVSIFFINILLGPADSLLFQYGKIPAKRPISVTYSYSPNGQTWGPEGTSPSSDKDEPAPQLKPVDVPRGTIWSFTGRLREDEACVRQEFGGKRIATFDLDAQSMPGITKPVDFWDPFGFSKVDDETLMWYRHSELKHARICMLACTGWLLNEIGIFFPGVEGIKGSPLKAWEATSDQDKGFILTFCLIIEWLDELRIGGDGHYLTGGEAGAQFLPLSPKMDTPKQAAFIARQKNVELNNGRLAMLGIASFFSAEYVLKFFN